MIGAKEEFETWEEVIVDFFEHRISTSSLFKARVYIKDKEEKIKSEKDDKKLRSLQEARDKKEQELKELKKNAPKNEIREWISKNSQKKIASGKRILKATHVLKFTHSSSSSDAFLLNEKSNDLVLSTASIKKDLVLDLAHNNGALISISRFLALKLNDKMIYDLIATDNFEFLTPFVLEEQDEKSWTKGFKSLIEEREIKTFDKAKQIYFPLKDLASKSEYHLLAPLFASSLQEKIKMNIVDYKYLDETKEIKKKKNNKDGVQALYHQSTSKEFKNLAVHKYGGDHPKNVSMLNANRGGNTYLLSCEPPVWQSQIKPPLYKKSLFYAIPNNYAIKENIDYLRDFLLRFESIDLSIKNPKREKHLKRWIENILDELFAYVATIQNLEPSWSKKDEIKLKKEHQVLLDPYRDDLEFQDFFNSNKWQDEVCQDFAEWLNNKLKGKDKKFTPQKEHTKLWKKLMKEELREFAEDLAFDVKRKFKEKK